MLFLIASGNLYVLERTIDMKKKLYSKDETYFNKIRSEIISLIPQKENKILEIGCGTGATLLKLKESAKASTVVGVDIHAFETQLDKFIVGDIEQIDLPYEKGFFDVIICADVLEHLIDPWGTVKKVTGYLKSGGVFIASIPNVRELKTMLRIFLCGDFKYNEAGILDKTHLRFFCKKNSIDLISQAGLTVTLVTFSLCRERHIVNKMSLGLFEEFIVDQYLIMATKR